MKVSESRSVNSVLSVGARLFSLLSFTGLEPVQEGIYILQAQQNVTLNLCTLFSKGHN